MRRLYGFDSVLNFRDFGDYPASLSSSSQSATIKSSHLFRSAHLSKADDSVLDFLKAQSLSLLVDLRQKQERARQPNRLPELESLSVLEFQTPPALQDNALAPHEMFLAHDLQTAKDAREYMRGAYAARPKSEGFQRLAAQTLTHMAETGGPILIHCAAGKDRTGTLAAIILGLLGTPPNVIMDDYMLTMEAVDVEGFLEPAAQRMSKIFGRTISPKALRPMFGVEPDYLTSALEIIGDLDKYLQEDLGLGLDVRGKLRANYLAE